MLWVSVLLTIVSDEELVANQIVKTLLVLVLLIGVAINVIKLLQKKTDLKLKMLNIALILSFSLVIGFVIREFLIEKALLDDPTYVVGITTNFCSIAMKGKGIQFEYEIEGKKYQSCNTPHPIPIDSIIVPNGKYQVRYSKEFPEQARMDFNKELK